MVRENLATRKRKYPNISEYNLLSLSDCVAIIRSSITWEKIFKKHFIIEKEDNKKSKNDLTNFLQKLVDLRNRVIHFSKKLENNEREELKSYSNRFDKIYEKWKHNNCQEFDKIQ